MQKVALFLSMYLVVAGILVGQAASAHNHTRSASQQKKEKSDIEFLKKLAFLVDGTTAVKYADADNDGQLSLQEASNFLLKYFNMDVSTEGLEEYDLNKDGFLSAEDIDIEKNRI